jgi:hypothetical protein
MASTVSVVTAATVEEQKSASCERPSLFINTQVLHEEHPMFQSAHCEISQYSITPTTLKERHFFDLPLIQRLQETIEKVATEKDDLDNRFKTFKECHKANIIQLKALSQGVIEDGEFARPKKEILALSEKFGLQIIALETYLQELRLFQEFIAQNPDLILTYSDTYANSSENVSRFGINVAMIDLLNKSQDLACIYTPVDKPESIKPGSSSKKVKEDTVSVKRLHPLEICLIQDAIDYLKTQRKKSVLIDIFARNDDGTISMKATQLETHTIVLYLQKDIIVIIDPSNSDFSKHLSFNNLRLFRAGGSVPITVPSGSFKIYSVPDKDKIGPNPDQYRDCIDIAVKIAFGLNALQEDINIQDFMSLEIIQEITNQQKYNDALFFDAPQIIARIRQASDNMVREKFNKLLQGIDQQMKMVDIYPAFDESEVQSQMIERLNQFNTHDRDIWITTLLEFYQKNGSLLQAEIGKSQDQLLEKMTALRGI